MEHTIDFKTYLISKKVDADRFKNAEKEKYLQLESIFIQMHPNSFTAQKLFLINPIRRKYLLKIEEEKASKPKMNFKPKIV